MFRTRAVLTQPRTIAIAVFVVLAALLTAALLVEPRSGADTRMVADPATGTSAQTFESLVDPATQNRLAAPSSGSDSAASESDGGAELGAPTDSIVERSVDSSSDSSADSSTPGIEARIVRNASVALRLKDGTFEQGWSDTQAIAGAFSGYVVSASRSGVGDGPRSGTIVMRVPAERFDRAVERVRELAGTKVERLDVASEDVTQEFVDVRSRLKHDRAVEGRLLALLAQTKGVGEVLAVQARLDQVQQQIEISRGRMQYLEKMTSMSTVEVSLREPGADAAKDKERDSVIGDAWSDAGERFSENIAAAIVWTGGALPALGLLALVGIVGRVIWRRLRPRRDVVEHTEPTL